MQRSQRETLISINTDDFFEAFGMQGRRSLRRALGWLLRPAAARFADEIVTFDRITGERGLQEASRWLTSRMAGGLLCAGAESIPAKGPLLVASNHPGMADTVALFASINRPDLKIVANDRPFLRALPNVHGRHLIDVSLDPGQRVQAVRNVMRALREGCAALTFPAGKIEPDPDAMPGAASSLNTWAESIGLLVRMVPNLQVVPAFVRGVVEPRTLRNPLSRMRRTQKGREQTASTLQVMWPGYQRNVVRVAFGPPLAANTLLAHSQNAGDITQYIAARARDLLERPPTDWRTVL